MPSVRPSGSASLSGVVARGGWLRVFDTYDDIIDAACDAWRRLVAQPETITSSKLRAWTYIGQS
jgi:hypothetical protein